MTPDLPASPHAAASSPDFENARAVTRPGNPDNNPMSPPVPGSIRTTCPCVPAASSAPSGRYAKLVTGDADRAYDDAQKRRTATRRRTAVILSLAGSMVGCGLGSLPVGRRPHRERPETA